MSKRQGGAEERGDQTNTEWPKRYAQALGTDLSDVEVDALLDLAREVAHGSERRFAPLSTFVAGRFVAARVAEGVDTSDALAEAMAVARSMLPADDQP